MKITKFGQCCLLIEVAGRRILTDPGRFSDGQNTVENIDVILITHEHADHLHSESLEAVVANNPGVQVVTNTSVGTILTELGISYDVLEGDAEATYADIEIGAFDGEHVEIFGEYGIVQNTGYFINNELFYPGDAYTNPEKPVRILALPVAGPWCRARDAINYALEIKPEIAFPVHDAILNDNGVALVHSLVEQQLTGNGISFHRLKSDECIEV
ncbi:MBL fold metallo-hydrolase [Candidatus Kaiserbacteria bacterium]|nr:MBL fold metallo-hydrolase [Candidatus Kaiserbacteria bacterium]